MMNNRMQLIVASAAKGDTSPSSSAAKGDTSPSSSDASSGARRFMQQNLICMAIVRKSMAGTTTSSTITTTRRVAV